MNIHFKIHTKAMPLNMAYSTNQRSGRRFKSQKYVLFESRVLKELLQYYPDIRKFNNLYNPKEHYLTAEYIFYHKVINIKDNLIGNNSGDTSNLIKTVEDCIFKKLNADDSQIMSIQASKVHSDTERIEVKLSIKDISHIR
jgi:Holliday junction resolvase RusA-like endonuclease